MGGHTNGPWVVGELRMKYDIVIRTLNDGAPVALGVVAGYRLPEAEANARLIASAPDGLAAAETAYLYMLQTNGALRVRNQTAFCMIRDFISLATGRNSEEVQNYFESLAAIAKAEGATHV